jgi:putative ABC transport system permease protein
VDILLAISPVELTRTGHLPLNYAVLAFTAVVSLMTAAICGLAPAIEGSRTDVQDALKDGARQVGGGARGKRLRQAFVVSELAIAVVLLAGAGLLLRSFDALSAVNPGFSTANVLTLRLQLPLIKYRADADRVRFFRDAEARIQDAPGVQAVGAISFLPLTGLLGAGTGFTIEGRPAPPPGQGWGVGVSVCDNGYFSALRLPLVTGRLFTDREMREESNVVIVSESLARTYFPAGDAIGKRLAIDMTRPIVPTEIVGVVGDIRFRDLTSAPQPTAYWPHPQLSYSSMSLVVRTASDPLAVAPSVERAIRSLDKDQPVSDVRTMSAWVAKLLGQARFNSLVLGLFAAIAMALASLGIYGVMAYAVSQRTSEIGVRFALGATVGDVLLMIVADGLRLAAAGLAIGLALAVVLSRTLQSLLFETQSTDPVTFSAVVVALGAVALLASYLPARRAARIAPVDALRAQ